VTLTYVVRNLRRRKVRSLLMVLALVVGVGALVALNATVDSYRRFYAGSVSGEVGAFDLVIARPDTAVERMLRPDEVLRAVRAVDGVAAAAPRIHAIVSVRTAGKRGDKPFVALDLERDRFGSLEVLDGHLDLDEGPDGLPGAVVLQATADVLGIGVGDVIEVRYAAPVPRPAGKPAAEGGSQRRSRASWVVRAIATQRGVTGQEGNEGIVVGLAAAQERFDLDGFAERVVVDFDRALYDSSDPQRSAYAGREVAYRVRRALGGDDYTYLMPRPRAVIDGANQFIFFQSLVAMYGLLSLGVVGLLIRTLIMTNVQEQTRDMAVLRILGAPRRHLFNLVVAEVLVVGTVGVGLGIVGGQLVNNYVVVPFLAERAGGGQGDAPLVSASAVLLSVLVAGVVLAISTLAPARRAAGTKVTHAINPGLAQGMGLDELSKLRERRTDLRITGTGLVVLVYPALLFFAFPLAFDFGVLWVMAGLIFAALLAMIVGAALVFFLVILPMERGLLWVIDRVLPRAGFFVRRTVLRGKERNTLISLMIVVSATLPAFLSTSLALEVANTETDRRLLGGSPLRIFAPALQRAERGFRPGMAPSEGVYPNRLLEELRANPGFGATVAVSRGQASRVRDGVGLRDITVTVVGVDADLRPVLYPEALELTQGDGTALERIVREPDTAIIGVGLATYLDRGVGDSVVLEGAGRDHTRTVTIAGVARRVGGTGEFSAKQTRVWTGASTVLVGMDTFRLLAHDPALGAPDPDARVVRLVMAAAAPGMDEAELTSDLRLAYATEHSLRINSTPEIIATIREEARTGQLFLIVLTALTSVLAVFGVFAVIYVSIYGRRAEIGMLKAIGSPGRHLLQVFVSEAMVMTLSATLTGVTAGVVLSYVLRVSQSFQMETPTLFAFDPIVVPAMLVFMILSSLVSALIATQSFRRQRAIDILRSL